MKAVIITGAGGFLGIFTARHLASVGWKVIGVGDKTPPPDLLPLFSRFCQWPLPDCRFSDLVREIRPELCVHCAGYASVPGSFLNPEEDFTFGPSLTFNLLEQFRRYSPLTSFIFLSSAAVYGNPKTLPINEHLDLQPTSPYGYHKMMAETICEEYAILFGIRTAILRIFSAYGSGLRRQVVWDICKNMTQCQELVLQGTGKESRDFVHAFDIALAIECVARKAPMQGEKYNVASGCETTIEDLAKQLAQYYAWHGHIRFNGVLPPGTPCNWRADIKKLATLGFTPTISLAKGLADFSIWFRQEEMKNKCRLNSA